MTDLTESFKTEKPYKLILKLAPPIMLAQLIQALYNIIDSLFVGRYSDSGLTALSIIYPLQLLMIALAVGTGVGINTVKARASYYRHISGKRWGEPDNYELTIDSSCGIEKSVDQIMQYLERNGTGLCTNSVL